MRGVEPVQSDHGYWFVRKADGTRVSGLYRRRDQAETVLLSKAKEAARTKPPCLSCGTRIMSEGPHHRMCGKCRHSEAPTFEEPYRIGN